MLRLRASDAPAPTKNLAYPRSRDRGQYSQLSTVYGNRNDKFIERLAMRTERSHRLGSEAKSPIGSMDIEMLSSHPAKAELYLDDTYFMEAVEDFASCLGDMAEFFATCAGIVLKPETFAINALPNVLDWL